MDLKKVNESVVSVILNLKDYKNLYSRNHAFSLRFNGKTITNSTGIAFQFHHEIYVICDGNIFAPYSQQINILNDIEMIIQFNHTFSKQNKYNAEIIKVEHLNQLQSSIENMNSQFKFGYLNNKNIHSHLRHKFAFIMLLKLKQPKPYLFEHIVRFKSFQIGSLTQIPSTMIGKSIFSVSNPFGILCSNVLFNTIHHGILSTNLSLKNGDYIWLSDMKYLPGMEGGIVLSNNHLIGIISIPLLIGNNATLTTILPWNIILSWLIKQFNSSLQSSYFQEMHRLSSSNTSNNHYFSTTSNVYDATKSVVPICIGSHWGSAILISKDHVLTNAHIIRSYLKDETEKDYVKRVQLKGTARHDSPKIGICIDGKTRKWLLCKTIYVTHSDSPWDVAWLRVIEYKHEYLPYIHPIKLHYKSKHDMNMEYKNMFENRNNVFVIGYGLIHPSNGLSPLVSSGILSQVVYHDDDQQQDDEQQAVILKTSADVHAGHSGGLLCDDNGYCLGLLTNNAIFDFDTNKSSMNTWEKQRLWTEKIKDDDGYRINNTRNNYVTDKKKISFIYPNLNSAVPFSIIYDLYKCIIDGGNNMNVDNELEKVFKRLDEPNEAILAKWSLVSPERLQHEILYDKKMESIMNSIPKHLLDKSKL